MINKCFSILVNNTSFPTTIKRLSGGNRNEKANLIRSLRNALEPQIKTFRVCNPLNPYDICPVTKKILGEVAKVRVNIAEESARAEAARLLKENENGKTQLLINEREQKLAATKESLKQLESQKKANLVSLSELRNPTLHTFKKGVSSAKSSAMSGVKGMFNTINSSLPYKLVFLFLFVFVFYKVIYRICIFFGIDIVILNMYLGWVSFLLVLFTFLPHEYGNILDSADVPAAPV